MDRGCFEKQEGILTPASRSVRDYLFIFSALMPENPKLRIQKFDSLAQLVRATDS